MIAGSKFSMITRIDDASHQLANHGAGVTLEGFDPNGFVN